MNPSPHRRGFLAALGATAAGTTVFGSLSGMRSALAASSPGSGYKALVCVYLSGGNDGFNWLVPLSPAAYASYAQSRSVLALPSTSLLPLNGTASDGNAYGLHPSCPELRTLYNSGKAAFVCNLGTLIQPTTAAQAIAGAVPLPPQLFSHLDQQTEWMTAYPQSEDRYGWAGRIADLFNARTASAPKLAWNITLGGNNYWQTGTTASPYVLSTNGPLTTGQFNDAYYRNGTRATTARQILASAVTDSNLLVAAHAGIWSSAEAKAALVTSALSSAGDFSTVFPAANTEGGGDWSLGQQLHEVARVIKAQSQIGDARQMFFVQIGGFDTHDTELSNQARLLGYVSSYLNTFMNAMTEIGQQNNVTTFTMSEFGRTLSPNNDGSDHGWTSHHLVLGGAVNGGQMIGTMPNLTLGGPDDMGFGCLVPKLSTDQYAATLAAWFGVGGSDLNTLFPNLGNFSASNLGFV